MRTGGVEVKKGRGKSKGVIAVLTSAVITAMLVIIASGATADGSAGPWADAVANSQQGPTKAGGAVPVNRSDPSDAVGPAEMDGALGSFYSLGFGGWIKLKFNNYICNGDGDDLEVYEVTWGAYPLEKAEAWVSQDGSNFQLAGFASNTASSANVRASSLPLPSGMPWAQYVLVKDVSNPSSFSDGAADGFDLTGVRAIHSSPSACEIEVRIDIKPGSYPNSINLGSKGNVPVAILSSPTFDATTVDPSTVILAGASPLSVGKSPQDVNGDGLLDIVLHFKTEDLDLQPGDTQALLTGRTTSNQSFYGSDSVRIIDHS